MPRKQYDYHFIYRTTNNVNNKFYIGMHSTSNLEDGYIGSGTRLWHSIKKHGKENFTCEILEFCTDRESLREREKAIVNIDLLEYPLCMNICKGGWGDRYGASFPNRKSSPLSESHKENISKGCEGKAGKYEKSDDHKQKLRDVNLGKKQDEKTKEKRAESLRNFWKESPDAEDAKTRKSESLKEAWKLRKEKPQKKRVYTKPLSMTPGAIKIREARLKQQLKDKKDE